MKEDEERKKQHEYIKIKEWEEKIDIERKTKEREEIRRDQRLKQRELEKIRKFEELENQSTNINLNLDLEEFKVDKSTKN